MAETNRKTSGRQRRGLRNKSSQTMKRKKTQKDQKRDDVFPFGDLPEECRLKILSYLTDKEKCTAALVCTSWTNLIRTPCLWTKANFVDLLYRQKNKPFPIPSPTLECQVLKERVKNFVFHLVSRRALLRELKFEFDLHEGDEIWLKLVVYLLQMTHAQELHTIQFNWTYTPHVPWFLSGAAVDAKESRVTSFHKLLMVLKDTSRGVQGFTMPFDWSPYSVTLLCQFKCITTLELSKYWVFHGLPQRLLNKLLQELPKLRRFKLEVAVPFRDSESYPQYTMSSGTLEELDIAACSGFFLWSVTLPNLRHFWESRTAWSGPILPRKGTWISYLTVMVQAVGGQLLNL
ncbi:uncharacterized protein LOC110986644 isoform X2 [Acanthaster planci]|uniref:Uncharacterized protein LOC110986644 isoform X2 n=1 Tax=Acanthaster planci TaxID=133434 RepID=A0A8B7ZFH2_ACAPL|nr:uncharacterized protein LOC110986644 isoform X2 [Acanthaster planci]